jgi:hypothetical protein
MSRLTNKRCPNKPYTACVGVLRYYPPDWWGRLLGHQGYYLCTRCGDHFWGSYVEGLYENSHPQP